jgi:molybdate transport system substrate-binding protein
MNTNKLLISIIFPLFLILSACGVPASSNTETDVNSTGQSTQPTSAPQTRTLNVFAAASLTDAFKEIGAEFEKVNPGVKVNFNFAGSQVLQTQLEQGAIADVFASANHKNMDLLNTDNLVAANSIQDFVTNRLVVILPPENPAKVETLEDLARPDLKLVLADSSVPAGNYTRQVLSSMSEDSTYGEVYSSTVLANVVSNETDVKQVVTKVELGEADAGIVYVSDAIATPDLLTISIPDQFNVIARYPIAVLADSPDTVLATKFIAYIMSPDGQAIMSKWGFSHVR